ncbi:MAG: hypothetical protein R6V50_00020 [Thermoplasmatota archaeon]
MGDKKVIRSGFPMKQKNVYSLTKAGVFLSILVLIASSFAGAALPSENELFFQISDASIGEALPQASNREEFWIHYDGDNAVSIGLNGSGTFEAAIRLTADEFGSYATWNITTVKFYATAEFNISSSFLKIYEEGNSTTPGDVIVSKQFSYPTSQGWYEIELDEQLVINGSDELWVGIEVTHDDLDHPLGADNGPSVANKSSWFYVMGDWLWLPDFGLDCNWNIRVKAEEFEPPVTTVELNGTMEDDIYVSNVTVSLHADDGPFGSGVNYTLYKLNDENWTEYSESFVVSEDGEHTLLFYSVDFCGNIEEQQTVVFTIKKPSQIVIEFLGGLGVSMLIMNLGETNITDVDWSIEVTGSMVFSGDSKSGTISDLGPDEDELVNTIPLGFGPIEITGSAGDITKTESGFLLFFLVLVLY